MMLAAQTLRHSSCDWVRVLAQEVLFNVKQNESKVALLTVSYLRLLATVLGDIYKFIVCKELEILQHLHETVLPLSVPGRSLLSRPTLTRFVAARPDRQ